MLIVFQDGFPIFFKQKRTGWDGRSFYIHKLRTLSKFKPGDSSETKQVESGDIRVLGIGSILRRFSIDELPQLFNILWGSMTLIGPRPPVPSEVKEYKDIHQWIKPTGYPCINILDQNMRLTTFTGRGLGEAFDILSNLK